ncbi:unnamed protein product [Aureobasidium uvarum]|uniref:F-box domain-containing protein n=1 Tax=Aureobasidium uvarum TaxID=2773716 RepID=A0A9N8PRJ2_9PEZI|nr:unnamed protein product [Aureobasidium uvarum]
MASPSIVQSFRKWRTTPAHTSFDFTAEATLVVARAVEQRTIAESDPSRLGFLDLPGEVRNIIYDLVVDELPRSRSLNLYDFRLRMPKMAGACKQIFRELVSVRFARFDSGFWWQGNTSGSGLDFSNTQHRLLSTAAEHRIVRFARLGAPLTLKRLMFVAPASHGTEPGTSRRRWYIHMENGTVRVELGSNYTGTTECAGIWEDNMTKALTDIMHQHGTRSIGIPELEAFRHLLGRFNMAKHFQGKSVSPQALGSKDLEMIKLKDTYLGCHLETHPWKFYTRVELEMERRGG